MNILVLYLTPPPTPPQPMASLSLLEAPSKGAVVDFSRIPQVGVFLLLVINTEARAEGRSPHYLLSSASWRKVGGAMGGWGGGGQRSLYGTASEVTKEYMSPAGDREAK